MPGSLMKFPEAEIAWVQRKMGCDRQLALKMMSFAYRDTAKRIGVERAKERTWAVDRRRFKGDKVERGGGCLLFAPPEPDFRKPFKPNSGLMGGVHVRYYYRKWPRGQECEGCEGLDLDNGGYRCRWTKCREAVSYEDF